jgi:hypothetical protein
MKPTTGEAIRRCQPRRQLGRNYQHRGVIYFPPRAHEEEETARTFVSGYVGEACATAIPTVAGEEGEPPKYPQRRDPGALISDDESSAEAVEEQKQRRMPPRHRATETKPQTKT